MNYFAFFETIKIPIIDNLQYFSMNSNFQSGILLAMQRLAEKMPNLKMTSIIYKGKIIHNQLPFEVISIIYNLFFSSYECTAKYNSFSNPTLEDITTIEIKEEKNEKTVENKNKKEETKKEKSKEENTENKKEIKNEEKKSENNEEKKDKNKKEENNGESNEIKEECSEKYKTSPYRKIFNINDSKLEFLTGIEKDNNSQSNYNIFIPKLYIKQLQF